MVSSMGWLRSVKSCVVAPCVMRMETTRGSRFEAEMRTVAVPLESSSASSTVKVPSASGCVPTATFTVAGLPTTAVSPLPLRASMVMA